MSYSRLVRLTAYFVLVTFALASFWIQPYLLNEYLLVSLFSFFSLLSPLILANYSGLISIKVVSLTSFISINLTVIHFFYFYHSSFVSINGKIPVNLLSQSFSSFTIISVFLILLILGQSIFPNPSFILAKFSSLQKTNSLVTSFSFPAIRNSSLRKLLSNIFFSTVTHAEYLFILLLILLPFFLNFIFTNQIAVIGLQPNPLPFRLNGIIYYSIHYLLPIIAFISFPRVHHKFLVALLLLFISLLIAFATLSKSTGLLLLLPVLVYSFRKRNTPLFLVVYLFSLFIYGFAFKARLYRTFVSEDTIMLSNQTDLFNSLFSFVSTAFFDNISSLFGLIVYSFFSFVGRFESFQNLLLSSSYDIFNVMPPLDFILRTIFRGFTSFPVDLHHLEWQGYVMPSGNSHAGALLSSSIIFANAGFLHFILFTLVILFSIYFIETLIFISLHFYRLASYSTPFIILFSLMYFLKAGFDRTQMLLICLLLFAILFKYTTNIILPKFR